MTRAVAYRHWLEMRNRLLFVGSVVALLTMLSIVWIVLTPTGPEVAHAWTAAAAALVAGLFLGGTGVRTNDFEPAHPSLYYTLTLPVSRFAWIGTRAVVAWAATGVLFIAMLVVAGVGLVATGQHVPLGTMAVSSVLAGLLAVAMQALIGLLLPLWDERLRLLAFVVVACAAISVSSGLNDRTDAWSYGWSPAVVAFIGGAPVAWRVVGSLALIVVASLSLAALIARRKDF